jgi:hypothetical protein
MNYMLRCHLPLHNKIFIFSQLPTKAGHEPAWAGLGASQSLARCKTARLGLARFSHELEKWARLELYQNSGWLGLAREPSIIGQWTLPGGPLVAAGGWRWWNPWCADDQANWGKRGQRRRPASRGQERRRPASRGQGRRHRMGSGGDIMNSIS